MKNRNINLKRVQLYRLGRLAQQSDHARTVRRALAVRQMAGCDTYKAAAERIGCAPRSVSRWEARFEQNGVAGLKKRPQGRPRSTVTPELKACLYEILENLPRDYGYAAARWTSQLLAEVLETDHGLEAHPSTLRRCLNDMGYRWRRARPAPSWRQDPDKAEKLAAINEAICIQADYTDVFFVDEARIELMPTIGFGWRPIGEQTTIPTPGLNDHRYLAAAVHKDTGLLTWRQGPSHDTDLILNMLEMLRLRYRRSKRIIIIMDNAPSHTSNRTSRWLDAHDRIEVRWQPTYTPQPNRVEKLWHKLHSNVTRNHRHKTMKSLMRTVEAWMNTVETFPNPSARSTQVDTDELEQI